MLEKVYQQANIYRSFNSLLTIIPLKGVYKYVGELHEPEKREDRHYDPIIGEGACAISIFLILPIRSVSLAPSTALLKLPNDPHDPIIPTIKFLYSITRRCIQSQK